MADPGQASRRTRASAAIRRGVGTSRATVRRVRRWTQTPLGRTTVVLATIGLLLTLFFALVGVPHIFRSTPIERVTQLDDAWPRQGTESAAFAVAAELATGSRLEPAATVEVLNDGNGFFPRLWRDLRSAQRSITIVNYYASPGQLVDSLHSIIATKARAGVRVYFVYDPIGSPGLNNARQALVQAGVRIAEFRPLRWYRLDRANHRTHVRAVVIDGQVGYTGGYGFDDRWLGDGRSTDEWRDTNVRVTGPPVQQLQAVFIAHWTEAAGELLIGSSFSGPPATDSTASSPDRTATGRVGILHSPAGLGSSAAERTLGFSVASAQRTLFVANAYFVPDDDFVRLLCDAARRGVDVRVLTNGEKSDVPIAWLAGRHRYADLLACGVRVFEYGPTVLHSKTLVVDGAWSVIGTINFDNRSLAFNEEVSLLALDSAIGAQMDTLFLEDLQHATEIRAESFARRSIWQKLRERGADLVSRWL